MKNASTGSITPNDRSDWATVKAMSDTDIHHDADSPRTVESDWDGALLKRNGTVLGQIKTRGKGKRPAKEQVAIRYDAEVLTYFRASGKGWQTRMNEALKEWLKQHAL